jgi:hypothetical protein
MSNETLAQKAMLRGMVAELGIAELFDNELDKFRRELNGRKAVGDRVYATYCMAMAYAAIESQELAE